jgi:hypothetical protein
MRKALRAWFVEFLWVISCALAALLIARFLFGWRINDTVDLHLHDTYFVFSSETVIIPFFLFLNFLVFCFKEARRLFSQTIPNIIMFVSGLLLIAYMTNLGKDLIMAQTSFGWTAYPPPSAVTDLFPVQKEAHPIVRVFANVIIVFQLVIIFVLICVSFQWGTRWKRKPE